MQEIEETQHHHSSKKRKMGEKVVVRVKVEARNKKQPKNEGPPSDCWSWRKYGQKPIKGSPYPRGYYRCSTSKGCSAKKQVERSKTDASMLIVTYTSTHNHPGPDFDLTVNPLPRTPKQLPQPEPDDDNPQSHLPEEILMPEPEYTPADNDTQDCFQCSQSPFNSHIVSQEEESVEASHTPSGDAIAKSPFSDQGKQQMDEYDFYDELEELPIPSFFTTFITNSFCEERVLVNLS